MAFKKQIGRYYPLLLVGLLIFSGFMWVKNIGMSNEIEQLRALQDDLSNYGVNSEAIQSADSLVIKGDYQKAITNYEQLRSDPDLPIGLFLFYLPYIMQPVPFSTLKGDVFSIRPTLYLTLDILELHLRFF